MLSWKNGTYDWRMKVLVRRSALSFPITRTLAKLLANHEGGADMPTYTVHRAKTQLSKLIAEAEAGDDVVITRGDEPVVRLVPVAEPVPRRRFGALAGKVIVGPEFFDDLPADEIDAWES